MTKYANFARVEGGGLQGNYLEIWTTECQMKVQSISAAVEAGEYQYCLQGPEDNKYPTLLHHSTDY